MSKVIVVGSGPSGLMAAWQLSRVEGITVHLIEKNDRLGKKLLASGGGMCNYTHHEDANQLMQHYGDQGSFLKHGFKALDAYKVEDLLDQIGIHPFVREDLKVFPASLKARQWVDAFESVLKKHGVKIHLNQRLARVKKPTETSEKWLLTTRDTTNGQVGPDESIAWEADAVVMALGGASYPSLGTSGDGYAILGALGIEMTPILPALCALDLDTPLSGLEGISVSSAQLRLRDKGRYIPMAGATTFGPLELLITHKGLTGPLILNSSRWFRPDREILINWLGMSPEAIDKVLVAQGQSGGKKSVGHALGPLGLPARLVKYLIQWAQVPEQTPMATLSKVQRQGLVQALTHYPVGAYKSQGMRAAMATAGGVALDQINPKTMGIKDLPGLYVVGELMDLDGDTGGYNIQSALTTGFVAAQHIIKTLQKG